MKDEVPEWLRRSAPSPEVAKGQLAPSREEMYRALELYYTHVKYVITIMFSFLTALFAILGLSEKLVAKVLPSETIKVVVGAALIIMPLPFALLTILIILRYYEVYVSSLIFALRVHLAAGVEASHPWFVRTIEQAQRWQVKVKGDTAFLRRRALSPKDTFFLYACLIAFFAILTLFCGLTVFWAV